MPQHEFVFDSVTMKMPHPIYDVQEVTEVPIKPFEPRKLANYWARFLVRMLRSFSTSLQPTTTPPHLHAPKKPGLAVQINYSGS